MANIDEVGVGDAVGGLDLGDGGAEARRDRRQVIARLHHVRLRRATRRLGGRGRRTSTAEGGNAALSSGIHGLASRETIGTAVNELRGRHNITGIRGAVQVAAIPVPAS